MKKKLAILLALAIMLLPAAYAATKEEAQATAQALVGAEATLKKSELDDGYYEFDFQDASYRYEVLVNAQTDEVHKLETTSASVKKSSNVALDETAARAAVAAAAPDAVLDYALLEKDDGRYEWNVFYTLGSAYVIAAVQTETGEVCSTEAYYNLPAGTLTAAQAVEALTAAKGALTLRELDLDLEERTGTYHYDGKAELNGTVYEFEISAATGDIIEWERD